MLTIFLLRSGRVIETELTDEQIETLQSEKGRTLACLYDGNVVNGLYLEHCAFDGTQIVSWNIPALNKGSSET